MKQSPARRKGPIGFERSYVTALGDYVKTAASSGAGGRLGRRARNLGVGTLTLAQIHGRAAAALLPAATARRTAVSAKRQAAFFAEAVAPIQEASTGVPKARAETRRLLALLARRTAQLEAARAKIKTLTAANQTAARLYKECRENSRVVELRLRDISRQLLCAQEEERMRISRDLHDAIGQTLTGINVGLATLKNDSAADSRELSEAISLTQRLVERSMKTVHQFAWELRPTLLDDLGIVPALRSYSKTYAERTGVKVRFSADAKFDRLDGDRKTALFRVAQGALSNVERHARSNRASVVLRSLPGIVRLEVTDAGRSFDVRRMERSKTNKHLGLLVMRERVEMVGGTFSIISARGRGTTVRADVPLKAVAP